MRRLPADRPRRDQRCRSRSAPACASTAAPARCPSWSPPSQTDRNSLNTRGLGCARPVLRRPASAFPARVRRSRRQPSRASPLRARTLCALPGRRRRVSVSPLHEGPSVRRFPSPAAVAVRPRPCAALGLHVPPARAATWRRSASTRSCAVRCSTAAPDRPADPRRSSTQAKPAQRAARRLLRAGGPGAYFFCACRHLSPRRVRGRQSRLHLRARRRSSALLRGGEPIAVEALGDSTLDGSRHRDPRRLTASASRFCLLVGRYRERRRAVPGRLPPRRGDRASTIRASLARERPPRIVGSRPSSSARSAPACTSWSRTIRGSVPVLFVHGALGIPATSRP